MSLSDPITRAMLEAVSDSVFPGAVIMVRIGGQVAYQRAVGLATRIPDPTPASLETIYDLASLTKPLATTSAVLCLVQEGVLALEQRVQQLLPELESCPVGPATVSHLLNHSSGLPAWRPFYQQIQARDVEQPGFLGSEGAKRAVLDYISHEDLIFPVGMHSLYSDLGFMLLGMMVERVSGQSLAEFCEDRIYANVGATPLGFLPAQKNSADGRTNRRLAQERMAATENDPWRGRILRGEVHDENAFAMGGVAGHAGLFGTAAAVLAVSRVWLQSYLGEKTLFSSELVRLFLSRQDQLSDSSWGLGWDTPSVPSSSGSRFSAKAFGHLGYTGTSLWVDPTKELEVVLLSNRVHPSRQNDRIQEFRPRIHNVIYDELIGK